MWDMFNIKFQNIKTEIEKKKKKVDPNQEPLTGPVKTHDNAHNNPHYFCSPLPISLTKNIG